MRTIDADNLLIQIQDLSERNQKLFGDLINESPTIRSGLDWEDPRNVSLKSAQENLFLCYQTGYPLTVGYWRTGYGWRVLGSDVTISPKCVARINLPTGKNLYIKGECYVIC